MLGKPFFVSIFVLAFVGLSDNVYAHHRSDHAGRGGEGPENYVVDVHLYNMVPDVGGVDCDFCNDGEELFPDEYHELFSLYATGKDNVSSSGDQFRVGIHIEDGSNRRFFLHLSDNYVVGSPGETGLPWRDDDHPAGKGQGFTTGAATVFSLDEPPMSLLEIEDGEEGIDRIVWINFHPDDDTGGNWILRFDPEKCPGTTEVPAATEVPVRRDGDTWLFQSENGIACLFRKKGGKGRYVLHGYYEELAFKFRLVRVQP